MSKASPPTRTVSRYVPPVAALKALAHPDRLKIIGILRVDGPSTATRLAQRLGLNSGATSYHLRQLAAHGFIEPAPELGDRRDRWWRSSHESTSFETASLAGEELDAGLAFTQAVLSRHAALMQRAQEDYRALPLEWRKASTNSDFIIPMTAEAAEALTERLMETLWEAKTAAPPLGTPLPEGTRPMTYVLYGFPYPQGGESE